MNIALEFIDGTCKALPSVKCTVPRSTEVSSIVSPDGLELYDDYPYDGEWHYITMRRRSNLDLQAFVATHIDSV